jgi:hypothetical protein
MNFNLFDKFSNNTDIKFRENLFDGSRVVPRGQTDVTQLTVAFGNFANAPKKIGFQYVRLSGEGEKSEAETKHDRRKLMLFHQR